MSHLGLGLTFTERLVVGDHVLQCQELVDTLSHQLDYFGVDHGRGMTLFVDQREISWGTMEMEKRGH